MLKALARNKVIVGLVLAAAFYVVIHTIFNLDNLIILLNGLFAGAIVAVGVTYSNIVWNSIFENGQYDRVRQMALGIALAWFGIVLAVLASIYSRANGDIAHYSELTAISRYAVIVAAIVQVTAPDLGDGIFFGRDRRLLYIGVVAGLVIALAVMMLQST